MFTNHLQLRETKALTDSKLYYSQTKEQFNTMASLESCEKLSEKGVAEADTATLIDGSTLEGGGQVLRLSVSLATILQKPVSITNIRGGRAVPGLAAQHVCGIKLVSNICDGILEGASIKSSAVTLAPGVIRGGEYKANIGTAGAVTLLCQIAVPPLLFSNEESVVHMQGGTNVGMSPQVDYFVNIFQPLAARFGVSCNLRIGKRGFYPKGGGQVTLNVQPLQSIKPVSIIDRGVVVSVRILTVTAGAISSGDGNTMFAIAKKEIYDFLSNTGDPCARRDIAHEAEHISSRDKHGGCSILCIATTSTGQLIGGSALGGKGGAGTAEEVGMAAAQDLIENLKQHGCVDEHMQDQLIVFMALACGRSSLRMGPLTLHTRTAIHFAQYLTGCVIEVVEEPSPLNTEVMTYIVHVDGIGHCRKNDVIEEQKQEGL